MSYGDEDESQLPAVIFTYGFDKDNRENAAWLIKEHNGLYSSDISCSNPVSHLLSDIEYELAEFCYGEGMYYPIPEKKKCTQEEVLPFLDSAINEVFAGIQDTYGASGDIAPDMHMELNQLQEKLADLIARQVNLAMPNEEED